MRSTPTINAPADNIDRALALLADRGFEFELVDRCPLACQFCDSTLTRAA